MAKRPAAPSPGDLAEVASGKGSARDKAEAAAYGKLGAKRAKATSRKRPRPY
jgi:hypothetical protein